MSNSDNNSVSSVDSDINIFDAVRSFLAKYGIRKVSWEVKREEKENYFYSHEWTDGDQLTFFVRKSKDFHKQWDDDTCMASVDDWEPNRADLMCKRLYDALVKHGIIQKD